QLLRRVRAGTSSITYAELAAAVSKKHPTHHRSQSFHIALGEVTTACRMSKLPCLPAIVWRAAAQRPGGGYYKVAHPRARTESAQLVAWEREHADVVRDAARFPASLPA
ncbi:MAG: hypothetical protein ABI175_17670, partial [Polyangiales bacterium]